LLALTGLTALTLANDAAAPASDTKVEPAQVANGVRSVPAYPVIWPEMPAGPNKDVYLANCVTCHSQRYVLMQPPFSRKVWTAEVAKMKTAYGATTMDDKVMPQIVDYLMAVRGTEAAGNGAAGH
jgi:mono/diheme cytochrome c family protein